MRKLILPLISILTISLVISACTKKDAEIETTRPNSDKKETTSVNYKVGDVLKDVTLKDPTGGLVKVSDLTGVKAKVIVFWSTECPVVKAYSERLKSLNDEYAAKGIEFIATYANTTEATDEIKEHASSNGYKFKALIDENHKLADELGASKTPEVFLLDASNKLVYTGRIDDSQNESGIEKRDLKQALDEVLAGKDVSVKETKSFGCTIKR